MTLSLLVRIPILPCSSRLRSHTVAGPRQPETSFESGARQYSTCSPNRYPNSSAAGFVMVLLALFNLSWALASTIHWMAISRRRCVCCAVVCTSVSSVIASASGSRGGTLPSTAVYGDTPLMEVKALPAYTASASTLPRGTAIPSSESCEVILWTVSRRTCVRLSQIRTCCPGADVLLVMPLRSKYCVAAASSRPVSPSKMRTCIGPNTVTHWSRPLRIDVVVLSARTHAKLHLTPRSTR